MITVSEMENRIGKKSYQIILITLSPGRQLSENFYFFKGVDKIQSILYTIIVKRERTKEKGEKNKFKKVPKTT